MKTGNFVAKFGGMKRKFRFLFPHETINKNDVQKFVCTPIVFNLVHEDKNKVDVEVKRVNDIVLQEIEYIVKERSLAGFHETRAYGDHVSSHLGRIYVRFLE